MRALRTFLLGLVLIAVVAPNTATGRHVKGHNVPTGVVGAAYIFSRQLGGKNADPVMAENVLRAFALSGPDDVVDRNLAWVRQSDWEPKFKAVFEGAVRWARTTRRKKPEELYRLSHEFRTRPNAAEKGFNNLASTLRSLAARGGHEQAKLEEAEWVRNRKREWSPSDHARMMEKIAKYDPDAMYMLADRYERAEGLARDLAKAYYWLLRARRRGGEVAEDVAIAIRVLDRRISTADKDRALKWFLNGTVPEL